MRIRKTKRLKTKVDFEFTEEGGVVHHPPSVRLKISKDCGVSCLVYKDNKWVGIKGKLNWIKIKND